MAKKFYPTGRCGKINYDSKFEADARGMWLNVMHPVDHPKPMRAYACSNCMKWHLTSSPLEK